MELAAYIVNAFSTELAQGNPAGVVLYAEDLPDDTLLKIAIDIGKSETAFIRQIDDSNFTIRWFSPKKEMPLCGHATLAAAKIIFGQTKIPSIRFHNQDNIYIVTQKSDASISLRFPLDAYASLPVDPVYRDFFPGIDMREAIVGLKTGKVILIVPEDLDITALNPDFGLMRKSQGVYDKGIALSKKARQPAEAACDIESRYFNPWAGVDEDPITGSVHTVLARYWSEKLYKTRLVAAQQSFRPGILDLTIDGDYVHIAGKARIVFSGKLEM